jgi:hypothetical protein
VFVGRRNELALLSEEFASPRASLAIVYGRRTDCVLVPLRAAHNLSSVAQGFGREVWRHQIAPHLDAFMGAAFEDICREHARRYSQERFPAPAQEIGRIWDADYDIDIAGKLLDGSMQRCVAIHRQMPSTVPQIPIRIDICNDIPIRGGAKNLTLERHLRP